MPLHFTLRAAAVATLLTLPAAAQDSDTLATADEVRAEISQAMKATVRASQ